MPTLEAIFRIFLANGNTPMTLEQVREQLAEWCPGGGCQWLLLPQELVERLVQNDTPLRACGRPTPAPDPVSHMLGLIKHSASGGRDGDRPCRVQCREMSTRSLGGGGGLIGPAWV